jgi:hypothetical protein
MNRVLVDPLVIRNKNDSTGREERCVLVHDDRHKRFNSGTSPEFFRLPVNFDLNPSTT